MKGLFIPEITVEMFKNGCLESIEALMAEGQIYDIDYPLEQEQKTGYWIFVNDYPDEYYECSRCKNEMYVKNAPKIYHYCPNCGAKMESNEEYELVNLGNGMYEKRYKAESEDKE